jgi:hypothetical protein
MGAGGIGNHSVKKQSANSGDSCFATDPAVFFVVIKKYKHYSPAVRRPWRTAVCLLGAKNFEIIVIYYINIYLK